MEHAQCYLIKNRTPYNESRTNDKAREVKEFSNNKDLLAFVEMYVQQLEAFLRKQKLEYYVKLQNNFYSNLRPVAVFRQFLHAN